MAGNKVDLVVMAGLALLFVVSSIIKKALEASRQKGRRPAPADQEHEASPDQVREFLEEVSRGAVQQPQPVAAEAVRPAARPREPAPSPTPLPQPAPKARRKPRSRRRVSEAPAQPPAKPAEPVAPVTLRVAETDLKKAIVWAEILGRPVSMRERLGHRAPARRK